jgi:hypothetical protein
VHTAPQNDTPCCDVILSEAKGLSGSQCSQARKADGDSAHRYFFLISVKDYRGVLVDAERIRAQYATKLAAKPTNQA